MKSIIRLFALGVAMSLLGCSTISEDQTTSPTAASNESALQKFTPIEPVTVEPFTGNACGEVKTVTLFAGQTIDAGTVTIKNNSDTLCIQTTTSGNWLMTGLSVELALDPAAIPNKNGNPIPGHFTYKYTFDPAEDSYQVCISLADHGYQPGQVVYVAVHTDLSEFREDIVVQTQTGWGDGDPFPGNNWATYIAYTIQECGTSSSEGSSSSASCNETAYAVGGRTFIGMEIGSDWGWVRTVDAATVTPDASGNVPAENTTSLFAGAGQNDTTTAGTKVGTVTAYYDGYGVVVTYNMFEGYSLASTHLFLSNDQPTTHAPGQYGNQHTLDPGTTSDIYNIPIQDDGDGIFNMIAHAVVCW